MKPAVMKLGDGFRAIDPLGADADDLVDLCDASLGPVQNLARQGRVVGDMQHDCRFTLVGRCDRLVLGVCPPRHHHH